MAGEGAASAVLLQRARVLLLLYRVPDVGYGGLSVDRVCPERPSGSGSCRFRLPSATAWPTARPWSWMSFKS